MPEDINILFTQVYIYFCIYEANLRNLSDLSRWLEIGVAQLYSLILAQLTYGPG